MDLKDRLKYYKQQSADTSPVKSERRADIYQALGAQPVDPEAADVLKIESFFPYDHYIYDRQDTLDTVRLPLISRNRLSHDVSLSEILILDLETTGLAGGAGTFPFLVGLGVFEPEGIRVWQYFLPEYGRETIAYLDIIHNFRDKAHLLSYNGKSYDYPLIRNRFILNRIDNPFDQFQHIDLLHYARRIWKNQLPDCSLTTIEQHIFEFHRLGDIEGWLIPQAYFNFLQTGVLDDIQKIVSHNQLDILSLGRLLLYMHEMEREKSSTLISDQDLNVLFALAVRNSDLAKAHGFYQLFLKREIAAPENHLAAYSLILKRHGMWQDARDIWNALLQSERYLLFALEELAKYYEHQQKEYVRAFGYTERGIKFLRVVSELRAEDAHLTELYHKFERRLTRLQTKLKLTARNI